MEQGAAFRLGVGVVIVNQANEVFWAKRVGFQDAWQFPQGGIDSGELELDAMYRELYEEVGLEPQDVEILTQTKQWHEYRLPNNKQRIAGQSFLGQRQKWYLLKLCAEETAISLTRALPVEFDQWQWVDYWHPLDHVVAFKREMYRAVLTEFAQFLDICEEP